MRWIKENKRLEDDQQQGKGKVPAISQYAKNSRLGSFRSRPRRELRIQKQNVRIGEVNVAFKEPIHKILEWIKNEPYFWLPSKMGGDPTRRNQNLYCTYHRDKGHTTKSSAWYLRSFRAISEVQASEGVCRGTQV